MIKIKEVHKKILIRVVLVIAVYFAIIFMSQFFVNLIYPEIAPGIFSESIITAKPFLDDFVIAYFSCPGNETNATFTVKDEYGNIRHNSSAELDCNTFSKVTLQGSPLDFTKDRRYIVYASFNNQTINSGYFSFPNVTKTKLIETEVISWFAFMVSQNKLARGTYTDRQRLLFADTGDYKYAKAAVISNAIGVLYVFTVFLGIDIAIWLLIWIRFTLKKSKV